MDNSKAKLWRLFKIGASSGIAFSLAAGYPNAITINWTLDSIGCDTSVEATIELYLQQKLVWSGEVVLHSQ